jgi:hypothetical protein
VRVDVGRRLDGDSVGVSREYDLVDVADHPERCCERVLYLFVIKEQNHHFLILIPLSEVCTTFFLPKFKFKNTLFSLGMFKYTYERQDIIQIALKTLPGEGERRKKGFSDLGLSLHVII